MLQAAKQPSIYINIECKAFYTRTAKSTIRNKNWQMKLAAQGSAKIDSYFYPVIDLTESKNNLEHHQNSNLVDDLSNEKDNSEHHQNSNLVDNSSDKEDYQFSLEDLEHDIKLGINDIRLQYVAQYLRKEFWRPDDKQPLHSKSIGSSLM
ncbi:12989_t:CDS:2, partial [Acaulospora morrowiae]